MLLLSQDYVNALLTGYVDPPAGVEIREGLNYSAFPLASDVRSRSVPLTSLPSLSCSCASQPFEHHYPNIFRPLLPWRSHRNGSCSLRWPRRVRGRNPCHHLPDGRRRDPLPFLGESFSTLFRARMLIAPSQQASEPESDQRKKVSSGRLDPLQSHETNSTLLLSYRWDFRLLVCAILAPSATSWGRVPRLRRRA